MEAITPLQTDEEIKRKKYATICVICDIDNVYTDSREWIKHLPKTNSRKEWDKYHTFHYLVKPNKRIINKIVAISKYIPIVFLTSREDSGDMKVQTIKEIESFSGDMIKIGPLHKLYMRDNEDYRPSAEVKEEKLLNEIKKSGYQPIIALDDDESNIEMYKKHGIETKLYDISKGTKE